MVPGLHGWMVLVAAIGVHGEDILPDRGPICGKNGDLRAVRRSVWSDVIEVIHEQRLRFAAIYTEAIDPGLLEAEAACCEDQPSPVWVPAGMPLRPASAANRRGEIVTQACAWWRAGRGGEAVRWRIGCSWRRRGRLRRSQHPAMPLRPHPPAHRPALHRLPRLGLLLVGCSPELRRCRSDGGRHLSPEDPGALADVNLEVEAVEEAIVDSPILSARVRNRDLVDLPGVDEAEAIVVVGLRAIVVARVDGDRPGWFLGGGCSSLASIHAPGQIIVLRDEVFREVLGPVVASLETIAKEGDSEMLHARGL